MKKFCYDILLNYNCNFNCLFCSEKKDLFSPSKNLVLKEIYLAKKNGFRRIGFSGGEPTLRKDLKEIISFSKKIGFDFIRVQTNGFISKDKKYLKELVSSGLNYIKFTVLSNKPDVNDYLTSKKGSFIGVKKAIENAIELKIVVGVNILINSYNYKELDKIVSYFLDIGVSDFVIIYPIYINNMFDNYNKIGVRITEAALYVNSMLKMAEEFKILNGFKVLNIPYCLLGIYANRASDFYSFDTVVSEPGGMKWDIDENVKKNKIKGKVCVNCKWKNKCYGVDKNYINIYGWSGFKKSISDIKNNQKNIELCKNRIYFTSDEKCIIEILNDRKMHSTENIISISKSIPICRGCKDRTNLVTYLSKLYNDKVIDRIFKNGKFYYKLL